MTRLEATTGSSTPGNAVLGRIVDVDVTERTAAWIGRLVAAAGIDINIAPSVDVDSNEVNPVIWLRAFSDTDVVVRHATAYMRGTRAAGVAACAKPFPRHGDTVTDSHLAAATSDISLDELRSTYPPPFRVAINARVKAIMSAHICIHALRAAPATINARSVAIARQLGLHGVIITDALAMAAIRATVGSGPGAVATLKAGADLLCVGTPASTAQRSGVRTDESEFRELLEAISAALKSGELPVSLVEEAAASVARLPAWRRDQPTPGDVGRFDGSTLAERAAVVVGDGPDLFTLALREVTQIDHIALGGRSEANAAALDAVGATRPDSVVINAGWSDAPRPPVSCAILIFGASRASAQAAARILRGR